MADKPQVAERKYVLTKLGAGDYLLPSNDRKTIWRIHRYTEGPTSGIMDWPRDVEVWGVSQWTGHRPPQTVDDIDDWTYWEMVAECEPTRASAIKEAMRLS